MKTKITIIIISFILISCGSASLIPLNTSKLKDFSSVEINSIVNKELGDILIEKGKERIDNVVEISKLKNDFRIYTTIFPYKVGDIIPYYSETKTHHFYSDKRGELMGGRYGITISKIDNRILPAVFSSYNGMETKNPKDGFEAIVKTNAVDCSECFKQQFIYNGKINNGLKFIYREFINDMARPAFSQDLQYDLADGNLIGFKGLRIEIIKATNTNIEYKVLSTFTK
jgi:hypothetical protein